MMVEPAYVGADYLAVLLGLTEHSVPSGFPAVQSRSWESRWLHWEMVEFGRAGVARGKCRPTADMVFLGAGSLTGFLSLFLLLHQEEE